MICNYSAFSFLKSAKPIVTAVWSMLICFSAIGQAERGFTRDGNKQFDKQKYVDAEVAYKKALEKKNNFPEAVFNLGDAYYKQKRFDEAAKQFDLSSKLLTDKKRQAQSWHNLGNCYLEQQKWEQAVSAYKQSLKLHPADNDTKYNLAFANEKLREQNKQKQQNKDQKQKQDQKQNQQQQPQPKDQKDQKDKDGKGNNDQQQRGEDKEKQPQPQKGGLTKEQAEKLLEALKREEQKAQEKMDKKTAKPAEIKVEKDW